MPALNDTATRKDADGDLIENGPRESSDRQGLSCLLDFLFELGLRIGHTTLTPRDGPNQFLSLSLQQLFPALDAP